ncbi:TRM32-like protein [Drosera capensis]
MVISGYGSGIGGNPLEGFDWFCVEFALLDLRLVKYCGEKCFHGEEFASVVGVARCWIDLVDHKSGSFDSISIQRVLLVFWLILFLEKLAGLRLEIGSSILVLAGQQVWRSEIYQLNMAKKSRRRVSRFERDQYGCIRGLISMLDFHHGRVSQKMLPDRKHDSKRVLSKLETSKDCSEINSDKDSEAARDDTAKLSVKELMEEEMIGDQTQTKDACPAEEEPQEVISTNGVYAKKKRRRMKKKSFDLGDAEESVSMSIASVKHKLSKSLDLTLIMEELCSQVPTEHGSHSTQDADSDSVPQPTQDSSVIEQQLGEATKVFMDHFSNEKSFTKDGKIQPSKELLDALHVLNSNKETFMKLLQDPDSQLLLHLQKLQDSRVRKDNNSQQMLEQVLDNGKQVGFFWRTFKGLERSLSKRNDISQDSNNIVVLKPGTPNSNNLETPSTPNNGLIERGSSNFSFSEFRRRLKLAVVKGLSDCRDAEKTVGGENVLPPRSPRKDHFFIEKAPRPPSNLKKGEYKGNPIDVEAMTENANSFAADQRASNIYVEARKHLAEIVGSSDVDLEFLGRQVPKSLGRILSFPDYNSPICSPRQGGSPGFAAIQRRPSSFQESQRAEEDICHQAQEINTGIEVSSNQQTGGQVSLNQCTEGEPSVREEKLEDETSAQLNHQNATASSFFFREEDSAVATEVSRSSDTEIEERSHRLNSSSVLCSSFSNGDVEVVNSMHEFEEIERALELNALEVSSASASQSGSSPIKVIINTIDRVNQASPDSVLVPLYEEEDDISPPVTKSLPGAAFEPIQPRQIQFEEQILLIPNQFAYINTCGEDKKSMFEFVKAVVQKSGLTWYELLRRSLLTDCILDQSIFDELECLQDRLCDDPKLIFDLVEETLVETRLHHLGPTLSSGLSFISSEFKGKDMFAETWKGVEWYFRVEGPPRTLDQVLALDYQKDRQWSDLRPDIEGIGIEMEETILEEVIEEMILNCVICDKKNESMVVLLESVDCE